MSSKVFNYLRRNVSQQPNVVDRLIVSAFLHHNEIDTTKNQFLSKFIISETSGKLFNQLLEFYKILVSEFGEVTLETLVGLFEFVISPADRIITGAIYTPDFIRDYIVDIKMKTTEELPRNWRACDMACGCGGFLVTLAKQLKSKFGLKYKTIFKNHLFGLDIKKYAITRTKLLLSLLALSEGEDEREFTFNLYKGDALKFDWNKHVSHFNGFDFVLGNPPYVCSRKIGEKTKRLLARYEVCSSGHPDLYIPFFQIGIEALKESGTLGFITMNSFIKSLNGRALRHYFNEQSFGLKIIDFGKIQVFKKRSTYTCICLIQRNQATHISYTLLESIAEFYKRKFKFNEIPYEALDDSGWNLLDFKLISKIEKVGQPFSKVIKTRNGIATLKNDVYIFKPEDNDGTYFYFGGNRENKVEIAICKDIINPNFLTLLESIETLREKIIFPYEYVDGKPIIISEQRFKKEFPCAYNYLLRNKEILDQRDKGKGNYPAWFAFGRTQSMDLMPFKLFFPHITLGVPNYILNTEDRLLFYNGLAVIGNNIRQLELIRKIMSSRLFWFYLKKTSKPYSSGYISMSKNYIKNFGIYPFSEKEIDYILEENNSQKLNQFIEEKYGVQLNDDGFIALGENKIERSAQLVNEVAA